jgi:hypothetical protein
MPEVSQAALRYLKHQLAQVLQDYRVLHTANLGSWPLSARTRPDGTTRLILELHTEGQIVPLGRGGPSYLMIPKRRYQTHRDVETTWLESVLDAQAGAVICDLLRFMIQQLTRRHHVWVNMRRRRS